jgi:hypothetical protein
MIFKQYYFPTMREKIVRLVDIENISVQPLTIGNGKLRLHGTGNIKTWYPKDNSRPGRDKVFFATLKNQWINIGFTVENSNRVEKILKDKKLLKTG